MREIDFGKQLNEQQLAAVTSPDGRSLVLAAAGTGKTRTLVYRVAHLFARGVPSDRILLLTFTNRAAHELLPVEYKANSLIFPDAGVLARVAANLPVTEGAERLISTLKRLGYRTAIISGGFEYFGRLPLSCNC